MGNKRKSISKKVRFEVFKRDCFTCQYCGQKAPDVVLVVDHVQPVSKGGTNDILNLVTSCDGCNGGKSDRVLSDNSVLEVQRKQLAMLQERREQVELMFQWQKGLLDVKDEIVSKLAEFWSGFIPGYHLNQHGLSRLRKLCKHHGVDEIMLSMKEAAYECQLALQDELTSEMCAAAFDKIEAICRYSKRARENPDLNRLYYIRGILRNRVEGVIDWKAIELLKQAFQCGVSIHALEDYSKKVKYWSEWKRGMLEAIEERSE